MQRKRHISPLSRDVTSADDDDVRRGVAQWASLQVVVSVLNAYFMMYEFWQFMPADPSHFKLAEATKEYFSSGWNVLDVATYLRAVPQHRRTGSLHVPPPSAQYQFMFSKHH